MAVYSPPVSPACVCSQWCDVDSVTVTPHRAVCWFLCSTNTLTLAVYSPPVSPACVCSQWCDVDSVTVTPHRAVCWFLCSTNTLTLAVYSPPVSPACVCSQWCDVDSVTSLLTERCVDSSAPLIHWHWLFTLLLCLRCVSALSGVMWTVLRHSSQSRVLIPLLH